MAQTISPRQFNEAPVPSDPSINLGPDNSVVTGFYNHLYDHAEVGSFQPDPHFDHIAAEAIDQYNAVAGYKNRNWVLSLGDRFKPDRGTPELEEAHKVEAELPNGLKPYAQQLGAALYRGFGLESIALDLRIATRNDRFTQIALKGVKRAGASAIILATGHNSQAERFTSHDLQVERIARKDRIYEAVWGNDFPKVEIIVPRPEVAKAAALALHRNMEAIRSEHGNRSMVLVGDLERELIASGQVSSEQTRAYADPQYALADLSELPDSTQF